MNEYEQRAKLTIDVSKALNDVEKLVKEIATFRQALTDGGKNAKVNLDTKSAVQQLNNITSSAEKLKTSLADVSKGGLNIDTKNLAAEIMNVQGEVQRLKESMSNIKGGINIEGLNTSLASFGSTLGDTFDKALRGLSRRLGENISGNMKEALSKLHDELDNLLDEIRLISAQNVSINTDKATQNVETLKDTLNDVKGDVLQMQALKAEVDTGESNEKLQKLLELLEKLREDVVDVSQLHLEYNTQQAESDTQKLLDKLEELKATITDISSQTIRVNVGNVGFDEMVSRLNRVLSNHQKIVDKTAKTMEREAEASGKIATDTKRTVSSQTRYNTAVAKATARLAKGQLYAKGISTETKKTKNFLDQWGSALLKSFYTVRGFAEIFQQAQRFAYQINQYVLSMSRTIVSTIVPAIKSLTQQGFESASTFEDSRVAYKLFFPNENPDDIIEKIQQRAIANPVFDATDLSKYVAQLAPLSGGDSQLTIDAIEGIASMLKASGQEVSTYMQRLVTNTQQVVSTGKATARDWNEFLRATPVFERVLAEVTPALRTKLNNDEAELTKSDTKELLKALQLVRTDSSISGVLDATAQSYSSLVQQFKESLQTGMGKLVQDTGFYDMVKKWLKESDRLMSLISTIGRPILEQLVSFMNRIDFNEVEGAINDVFFVLKQLIKDIMEIFGVDVSGFNTASVRKIIKKVAEFIADFVRGWAEGIKDTMDFAKSVLKFIGQDPSQLAKVLGKLASPWGQMMSMLFNMASGAAQMVANISSMLKGLGLADVFSPIKDLAFAKLGSFAPLISKLSPVLSGSLKGLLVSVLGSIISDAVYGATKSISAANFIQIGSGIAGGAISGAAAGTAIAPGIGTAIGAAIGAAGSGIIAAISAGNKTSERIAEKLEEITDQLKSEYAKTIEEHLPAITRELKNVMNLYAKENNLPEIDWNSDAGAYAASQIEKYFKETPAGSWQTKDVMKIAQEAYNYQKLRKELDDYTETEGFRNINTGDTITAKNINDYKSLRDRFAEVIKTARLNGPEYDYGTAETFNAEQIVADYLNGQSMTTDQIKAIIDKYGEIERSNKTVEEQFAENVDSWNTNLLSATEASTAVANKVGALNSALLEVKTAIEGLTEAIDTGNGQKDYGITWWGQVYEKIKEGISDAAKKILQGTDMSGKSSNFPKWDEAFRIGKFNGGFIQPIYKASGGGIHARGVDTVPAMLQPGEFVVRKSAVQKFGLPAMTALNLGDSKLAARLIGRPNITTNNAGNSYAHNSNDNRRSIRQYINVVNRNNSATLNSYHSLANRLALI